MSGFLRRGINFFFKRNLLLTNSITSGGFMVIGDWAQQELNHYKNPKPGTSYDWTRAGRMFVVGSFLGPLHHYYYLHLDKLMPEVTFKNVALKILSDELIASPATILIFFVGMAILERKTWKEFTDEMSTKFLVVYVGDLLFWPPIQFVNFYFVAGQYRVFYINCATMIFNCFISYMKHEYEPGHF